VPQSEAVFSLPAQIGDYTDFYISIHHATGHGRLFGRIIRCCPTTSGFRSAITGRSSSIAMSARSFRRPQGQRSEGGGSPTVGPSTRLDYELEMGIFIGARQRGGKHRSRWPRPRITSSACACSTIGSARDLQGWNTSRWTVSGKKFRDHHFALVVSLQALAPISRSFHRPESDPQPFALFRLAQQSRSRRDRHTAGSLIQTSTMLGRGEPPRRLSATSFRHAYWRHRAARGPSHHQRLQSASGRLIRQRHAIRTHAGRGRLVWWN